uniref:GIY-YIG domain-containing protein n=1 Tax=viral metagenome TaxID=1070528 RepID=A0A6C0EUX6_9ZZZZ
MAYIYRILNKLTKKCYIGETKCIDVSRRWNQHKQTIEINKGCPALRDAVKKYGIDNFEFSVLIICFDDERFKYEIEYIKKYNSVVPNGYNLTNGGEGGGFQGKTHTEEVKNGIKNKLKQKFIDNPELKEQMSERNKIVMSNPEVRDKIKNGILNSEKWKKVVENMRNGNHKNSKHSEEIKNKISESLKKYHANNVKISKNTNFQRDNKLGKKIKQYDMNNNLLNEYTSISDASRKTSIQRKIISLYLRGKTNIAGGFIWKYA